MSPFASKAMLPILSIIALLLISHIPCCQCAVVHQGESIQAAIDAAHPGDLIEVEDGTYQESLDINKPVALRGLGYPVIDANGNCTAVILSANGTSIEGFIIANSSIKGAIHCGGIIVASSGNKVLANRVFNNTYGICIKGSSNNKVENNTVNGSIVLGIGILLEDCRYNLIEENIVSHNMINGIALSNSTGNTLRGNRVFHNADGFPILGEFQYMAGAVSFLYGSRNNTLKDNEIFGNCVNFGYIDPAANDIDASNLVEGKPLRILDGISGITINSSTGAGAIYCLNCSNITIDGLEMTNNTASIWLESTKDSSVKGCRLKNSIYGTVSDFSSTNITFENNTIEDCLTGIYLSGSRNKIAGNAVKRCYSGISIKDDRSNMGGPEATDNRIMENTVSGGIIGIDISSSTGNILQNNSMYGNLINLDLGDSPSKIVNEIGSGNFVNGKRVFCLKNKADMVIDSSSDAGMVVCINCSNLTLASLDIDGCRTGIDINDAADLMISGCRIRGCSKGMSISSSRDGSIEGNTITDSGDGISIASSNDIAVKDNRVSNISRSRWISDHLNASNISDGMLPELKFVGVSHNTGFKVAASDNIRLLNNTVRYSEGSGIWLEEAEYCSIAGCLTANNSRGMALERSNNNTIRENQAIYNEYGLKLSKSNGNRIYSNVFADNEIADAVDEEGSNYWDNGTAGN